MFLTSSESALAFTGLYSGFFIVNVTIELLSSKAPCQFLGLNGLIGVNASISDLSGIIGPFAE